MIRSVEEALRLVEEPPERLFELANGVRLQHRGRKVHLCSIVNAKSGKCGEDCRFCAQSLRHRMTVEQYPLKSPAEIEASAREALEWHRGGFGIVTSGRTLSAEEVESVVESVERVRALGLEPHASLGEIDSATARRLNSVGLLCYNHNLEASPSFFSRLCTTHSFEDRLRTARIIRESGLRLCCGGIFGVGEGWRERIELAFALRELSPDVVPINFLHPVRGTPLESMRVLEPMEALKIIAVFRLILPGVCIKVAGGRELVLREHQNRLFYAGADGIIIGNYLTTRGRRAENDLRMIRDLGLEC